MAEADKDGRMAQIVQDMHTILGMEIHNDLAEAQVEFDAAMKCAFPEREEGGG